MKFPLLRWNRAAGATPPAPPAPAAPAAPLTEISEADAQLIADAKHTLEQLLPILRAPMASDEQRDLALAKQLQARDFDTSLGGATVRNVMRVGQAHAANHLSAIDVACEPDEEVRAFHECGIVQLIQGRAYVAIVHGEGEHARVSFILNGAPDKFRLMDLVVWQEGVGLTVLTPAMLADLLAAPDDRIILGPFDHHGVYAGMQFGELYHEAQSGQNCALHAMNAMVGAPLLTKSQVDQFLISERLENFGGTGITEDDFYRNHPTNEALNYLFDFDAGLQPDVVESLANLLLDGRTVRSQSDLDDNGMIDFAMECGLTCNGAMIYSDGHYVAFHTQRSPEDGRTRWHLIDSARRDQPHVSPAQYLVSALIDGPCVVFGWHAPESRSPSLPDSPRWQD